MAPANQGMQVDHTHGLLGEPAGAAEVAADMEQHLSEPHGKAVRAAVEPCFHKGEGGAEVAHCNLAYLAAQDAADSKAFEDELHLGLVVAEERLSEIDEVVVQLMGSCMHSSSYYPEN